MGKLVYILLDGVGDRPDPGINHLTPLDVAYTPSLDTLARRGASGLVYPVGEGISPESDIAVFCMLGYDVSSDYFGRGVVEAIGMDMEFKDGDLALRANFASVGEDGSIMDRRAGRDLTQEEAAELAEAVNENVKLSHGASFQFRPTVAHRAVLTIRVEGTPLSAEISNTDPAYIRMGGIGVAKEAGGRLQLQKAQPLDRSSSSRLSAELVNEFTEKALTVLGKHSVNLNRVAAGHMPANVILLRDAGNRLPKIKTVAEKFGVRFAGIMDMPVEKGVAKITGISEYRAGGLKDYRVKAERAIELLNSFDGVYIHLKGPDEPGHDGNVKGKVKAIEEIDSEFFTPLVEANLKHVTFIVSADHSTPCQLKSHSADPVPLLISGPNVRRDSTCRFTEREAAKGSFGIMRGVNVLSKGISLA